MKFDAARRGVLKLIGAAPAAPLVAKVALDKELAKLTGVKENLAGTVYGPWENAGLGAPSTSQYGAIGGYVDPVPLAETFFKTFGIPEHIEDDISSFKFVEFFDPDIAAKRSWSHSVKVATQRERNRQTRRENVARAFADRRKRAAFKQLAGFEWPFGY